MDFFLFTKLKLYVKVCLEGVWLCSCVQACSVVVCRPVL